VSLSSDLRPPFQVLIVYLLDGLGIETGVDLDKLVAAGQWICGVIGREPSSKAARAIAAKRSA